jgi:hypothetical protein
MPYNTCGYDEIPTNVLTVKSVNICSSLNHVCNTSLLGGIFSLHLQYSVVNRYLKGMREIAFLITDR